MRDLPHLGLGLGLRVPHYATIFAEWPAIDFFEIIAENYLLDGGLPLANLDRIRERYPLVCHGVSLNIGSADPLDHDYLRRLKALVRRIDAPWFSDHLCWTGVGGAHRHDLLPLPYTEEVVAYVAERARIVQDVIERPFALENVSSYVTFRSSTLSEWEFYRAVVERADCRMLFDVNNAYVSAFNHGFDPMEYLRELPYERVQQVHLAGPTPRPDGGLIDTHSTPVRPEVWELYRHVHQQTGGVTTLLEWDGDIPSLEETWAQAQLAKRWMQAEVAS